MLISHFIASEKSGAKQSSSEEGSGQNSHLLRKGPMEITAKERRYWLLLAALPLSTGAALIVYVLFRISLGFALLVAAAIIIAMSTLTWCNLPPPARAEIVLRRIRSGLLAGMFATICYDLIRWALVVVFHFTFWPFDIFPLFGRAIAGAQTVSSVAYIIGILYHYANGTLFAIAYAILLAPRGWWAGICWAIGLEAFMLFIYPGWLHIQAFNEFLSISMLGHIVYGSVLGVMSRWILALQKSHCFLQSVRSG